jgi:membrane protein implicated in regulation of membrane protease activity
MEPEPNKSPSHRENMLAIALVILVGGMSLFFLYIISLGIIGNILSLGVVLALIFSVHYFLWGRNFSAEIAAERERLRRQDAREAGRIATELPADAIQDLSRTQGIQER